MENNDQQKVVKKENKNFLIGVIAIALIALYSTNPTQQEFNEFISKEVKKKLAEKMGEQNFVGNLVAGFAGTLVNEASVRKDYLFFSTYKVDLSIARMFGAEYSDLKFVGIAGQLIPFSELVPKINPNPVDTSKVSPRVKEDLDKAPNNSQNLTYLSIYYAANAVRNFRWGVGYASQYDADQATEAACQKSVGSTDTCKKLIGGQYRCLAVYQNSLTIYANINNDLETAKRNAYASCTKDTTGGDTCVLPEYGATCAGN
jgi:hypothetical protein